MLNTPLGPIMILNGQQKIPYTFIPLPKTAHCPNVNGRFSITVPIVESPATIQCIIENELLNSYPETGENLEALSFYKDDVKLTIGITADFTTTDGQLLKNGLEVKTAFPIEFGVCWIQPVTESNDVETFFGADLFYK
ncbi:hypothetical protein [Solibacillus daqui]|uniref:hypothetical protein n=1 Tax=Solibacillus daqui TaxID=2912187 RepID=UPI002366D550|nr:hypothetical protein [Solibacillus daqui]